MTFTNYILTASRARRKPISRIGEDDGSKEQIGDLVNSKGAALEMPRLSHHSGGVFPVKIVPAAIGGKFLALFWGPSVSGSRAGAYERGCDHGPQGTLAARPLRLDVRRA